METIDRSRLTNHELFGEIIRRESHHNHPIEEVENVYRWVQNSEVRKYVDKIGLNEIISLFILYKKTS